MKSQFFHTYFSSQPAVFCYMFTAFLREGDGVFKFNCVVVAASKSVQQISCQWWKHFINKRHWGRIPLNSTSAKATVISNFSNSYTEYCTCFHSTNISLFSTEVMLTSSKFWKSALVVFDHFLPRYKCSSASRQPLVPGSVNSQTRALNVSKSFWLCRRVSSQLLNSLSIFQRE